MIFIILLCVLVVSIYIFLHRPPFGSRPRGERLQQIMRSSNFKNGSFQNKTKTPDLTEGASYFMVLKEFLFKKQLRAKPGSIVPSVKTNLHALPPAENVLVWFGHSSYFIQVDGIRILVDPVLGNNASPVSFTTKSFKGSNAYTPEDMPAIDYLFITHDHWDHLDYSTLLQIQPRVKKLVCGLGVGQHLERWGFHPDQIIEKDWYDHELLEPGFRMDALPARHFSGRGLKRNNTLWMSYALSTPSMKIYIGGDSGYDSHFKAIGDAYGPFDLAILECGQYDRNWKYIHMMPAEVVTAAQDLRAKKLMPVHWGKFGLANHDWDDPILQVVECALENNMPLCTPMIGEPLKLDSEQQFNAWWKLVT